MSDFLQKRLFGGLHKGKEKCQKLQKEKEGSLWTQQKVSLSKQRRKRKSIN